MDLIIVRQLLFLCLICAFFVDGDSDGIEKRDVHRIILKSRKARNHHGFSHHHVPEKYRKNNHRHEDRHKYKHPSSESDESSEEIRDSKRKQKNRHHHKHDRGENYLKKYRYSISDDDSSEEIRLHKPKRHLFYANVASESNNKWTPLIAADNSLLLSPPPFYGSYRSESQQFRSNRENDHIDVELTTIVPTYNLPTFSQLSDEYAPKTTQDVFVDFDQTQSTSNVNKKTSRPYGSRYRDRNNSYEVREEVKDDGYKKRVQAFKILAPTQDIGHVGDADNHESHESHKSDEKGKGGRVKSARFRGRPTRPNRFNN